MKRFCIVLILIAACGAGAWAQYPFYSIRQLQQVPAESLAAADAIPDFNANSSQPRWTLQTSPHIGDTVRTAALVVVPPGVITFTTGIWTMLLYDTAAANTQWGGVLLRANAADTNQLKIDGFLNVSPGDVITLTGAVSEFPTSRGFSATQLAPLAGNPITIIGSGNLPKPIVKNIADFYQGVFSSGKVQVSTGEPFESMIVEFRNVTINNKVNTGRGTFSFVDGTGNELSNYDWSHYFTLGHGSTIPVPGDTAWARIYAGIGVGTRIDTIRGVITTSSGSEGPRGYRICPLYPGDIVFSKVSPPPLVSTHRRNPVIVSPDSSARVSVRVVKQTGGVGISSATIWVSYGYGPFMSGGMTYQSSDTTYFYGIPTRPAGTFVRYYIQVADSAGNNVILANAGTGGASSDTSKGYFFYAVLTGTPTIRDVQYTPYVNGRSPYVGAVTSTAGIVTADTSRIGISPLTTGSTNAWYMQSTNQPWSGIWLATADTTVQKQMAVLRNGDSVRVTGTVQEQFDVTRLGNITALTKISSGNPEPVPVVLKTGDFNVGNGAASAEPYEGMLVQFKNVTVTDVNPTFSDPTEYAVNDGSGAVVVQRSGKYKYSNVPSDSALGKTILQVGSKIGTLTGIVYYSFNQYKFVPRTDADFQNVVLTGVAERFDNEVPTSYRLAQNYPNPFNPQTTIEYQVPKSTRVVLKIYNVIGQDVGTLVNEDQVAGTYRVRFDAGSLTSGMYFYRLVAGDHIQVRKMLLVK